MAFDDKINKIKLILGGDEKEDVIGAYLEMAESEIMSWSGAESVSPNYDTVQIMAVIAGYNLLGAENQTSHSENGISRVFKYSDMLAYIRNNVCAKVVAY